MPISPNSAGSARGTKLAGREDTIWQADGAKLTADKPLTLTWDNGQGVRFSRIFTLDKNFMLTVTQRAENGSASPVKLYPYGRLRRTGTPATGITRILHEGADRRVRHGAATTTSIISAKSSTTIMPDEYRKVKNPDGSLAISKRLAQDCLRRQLHERRRLAGHHRQILAGGTACRTASRV